MSLSPTKRVADEIPGLVTLYDDGSIVRHSPEPPSPCSTIPPSQSFQHGFASLDLNINPISGLWARAFVPHQAETTAASPVILHFHGGGFCVGSPSWLMYRDFLGKLAVETGAIWVSVAYRLAPEHRLPAGYYDCLEALDWFQRLSAGELDPVPWLSSHADFGRFFLAGDSAGANIAFHVAVHYASATGSGLRLVGFVLLHPGFVKEERSRSETANPPEALDAVDAAARMALPEGQSKDYFILNPAVPCAEDVILVPCLVAIGGKDLFRDRQMEFCDSMAEKGQRVEVLVYEELGHCFALTKGLGSSQAVDLVGKIVKFMRKCMGG